MGEKGEDVPTSMTFSAFAVYIYTVELLRVDAGLRTLRTAIYSSTTDSAEIVCVTKFSTVIFLSYDMTSHE